MDTTALVDLLQQALDEVRRSTEATTLQADVSKDLIKVNYLLQATNERLVAELRQLHLDRVRLEAGLQYFNREETMALLKVSERQLETWARKGVLVPLKIEKIVRYQGLQIIQIGERFRADISQRVEASLPTRRKNTQFLSA